MIERIHPVTGDRLSAIGFGGMRFRNQNNLDECVELILKAYEAGINYFDTAPGYGKSEELFGIAFREIKKNRTRRPFYVATKTFANTPDKLRKDVENSLQRMGIDSIDYYHMWCILSLEGYYERKPILKEFERLKEEGLIRHIAVSTHMKGRDIGTMLDDYPFVSVLLGYSVMNFLYREEGIQSAADRSVGVVVMNPLGGGIIPQHPERFRFLQEEGDSSIVHGALRFLLSDPRITVVLVGLSTLDQLREAVQACENFIPWSQERIERVRQELCVAFDSLCTGCSYCDRCPQQLPLPQLMDAYNQFLLTGQEKKIIERLRYQWNLYRHPSYYRRCIQCGACEKLCTQHLPIMERIERLATIVEDDMRNQQK